MRDAGYTLAETLASLVILGLVIGAVFAGLQLLARQQANVSRIVAEGQALRAAQAQLDRLFEGRGPYRSHEVDRFVGRARQVTFDCAQQRPCSAALTDGPKGLTLQIADGDRAIDLPLGPAAAAHFVYEGPLGESPVWPLPDAPRQPLRVVAVVAPQIGSLARSRVWIEQPARCAFDVVLQDCR